MKRALGRAVDLSSLSRPNAYLIALAIAFLIPLALPGVGIDDVYFFIFVIVFIAWLIMKWNAFSNNSYKSTLPETVFGIGVVVAVYAYKIALSSREGLLDMVIIFAGLAVAFFGFKSFKLFWVPAAYGVVLLLGYQVENDIPNYVVLQDWLASVLAATMNAIGIVTRTSGHIIILNANSASPLYLDVESDCTGIQGVLAFGLLSTMAVLDVKRPKFSRLVTIFALGFIGVFLINILRLVVVVLTFDFLGVSIGNTVHVYAGYLLFVVWVLVFWSLAFKYLPPQPTTAVPNPALSPSVGDGGRKPA